MSEHPSTSHGFDNLEFQRTKRGHRMLCRGGYDYIWKRNNKDGSEIWRCTKKKTKCNAILKVSPPPFTILHETIHNHSSKDHAVIEIERQMQLCTEAVKNNINKPVPKIFEESMEALADKGINLLSPLPKFNNIKNKLYNQRNKALGAKKLNFKNATILELPKKYEDLLFADYTYKNKRIIIFAKKEMTKYLKESKRFFVDGTFKICPNGFHQVYTFHADIGSNEEYVNIVPVLYALLPDRKQVTYEILFEMIKSQVQEWEPTHISMDFEVTAILAIKGLFPEVKIVGCFFHFSRSLWRKAKQLGVIKSRLGRIHVKLCTVLSHLPLNLLDDGWLYVMGESPNNAEITKFNDYFVQTWLQHPVLSKVWNTFNESHRTNNMVESWNGRVKKIMPLKPNIGQFLSGVEKDAKFYYNKINQSGPIQISKRKKESMQINDRINNTIQELLTGQISIGHCLEKLR